MIDESLKIPMNPQVALQLAELERIKMLASQIRNNRQFKHILRQANPKTRRGVYNLIAPHLKFKAQPFEKLVKSTIKEEVEAVN